VRLCLLSAPDGFGAVASDSDRLVRADWRALLHGVSKLVHERARTADDLLELRIVESLIRPNTPVFVVHRFILSHT
jgi:hypothetical protein